MKKTSFVLAAALAATCTLSAESRLKVVATSFPHYDWTRQILGDAADRVELTLLQQSGADLHSYQPTADDLLKVARCDLFVYVGGESDEWTERALKQKGNSRRRALSLLSALGDAAKEEKVVEGMEHEHHHRDKDHGHAKERGRGHDDHGHGNAKKHGHGHDDDRDEEHELDEHVWLSLRNAAKLTQAIAGELAALDPANAAAYRRNAAAYRAKLSALDRAYADAVARAPRKTILVADRFPFRYLADDYGLAYFAAFAGCSAESEASFKTVAFLAKKTDELKLPVILTIEGAKHKIAETVRNATERRDQRILALDSLQSTGGEAAEAARYLDVMARNLEVLKAALGN
ncbi:MAG: zinc ABC transporter substrate-binding protein [Kiritimatiellae bacterium]|nr:zinc ABC transporter substrate-binding protein [Kiritimatiellia bacterium]